MIAEIVVDITTSMLDRIFDYEVPENLEVSVGDRVLIPFANRKVQGYVINLKQTSGYDKSKLKQIISKLDAQPLLSQNNLRLCFFMKENFFLRLIDVIKLCLPPLVVSGKVKDKIQEYI